MQQQKANAAEKDDEMESATETHIERGLVLKKLQVRRCWGSGTSAHKYDGHAHRPPSTSKGAALKDMYDARRRTGFGVRP
eukprot:9475219-Pyramimonas_sp.AAC.1